MQTGFAAKESMRHGLRALAAERAAPAKCLRTTFELLPTPA